MTTTIKSNMTIAEKRELVTSLLKSNRFASITFEKKPSKGQTVGEVVTRSIKLWVEKYLTSGNRNDVGVNQAAQNNDDLFPYADFDKEDYRSFALSRLKEIKADKQHFIFQ
jgi:hypothetical protein